MLNLIVLLICFTVKKGVRLQKVKKGDAISGKVNQNLCTKVLLQNPTPLRKVLSEVPPKRKTSIYKKIIGPRLSLLKKKEAAELGTKRIIRGNSNQIYGYFWIRSRFMFKKFLKEETSLLKTETERSWI